jgi:DNA-binding beta-propeller fold protein YncE
MTSTILQHPILSYLTKIEVLLFLALWLSYGILITTKNVEDFGQNQATVEAIVDQHRFSVDNLPNWEVTGDFFGHNGHRYMNKQPGQGMVGAVAYAPLKLFGFSYSRDKIFTGALVVFFTASLLTAFAGAIVFRFGRDLIGRRSNFWPLAAAMAFGWGTITFAYAGIAHHDLIAGTFLITAFYLIFQLRADPRRNRERIRTILAGLLLGFTLTTSMIPFFMAIVVGIYFLSLKKWHLVPAMLISGVVGLLPMLLYNTINFGNPLTLPMSLYIHHPVDSVYFSFQWENFVEKLRVYSLWTYWYGPVLFIALIGLALLVCKRRREGIAIATAIGVLVFYISNIMTLGTCNWGPRFMLAAMPFASLGIVGLHNLPGRKFRVVAGVILAIIGLYSIWINFVGAVGGAMFCNLAANAYPGYLADIMNGKWPAFPLMPYLLPFTAGLIALIAIKPFVPAVADPPVEEEFMPADEPQAPVSADDEELSPSEFVKANKVPLIILAVVGLVALYPLYSFLFPSVKKNAEPVTQLPVAATPESGEPVNAFEGGTGRAPGRFVKPRGMASDTAGNIYVTDTGNARVQKFDPTGKFLMAFDTGRGTGPASQPIGIAVDKSNNIFVTDLAHGTLMKFSPDGKFVAEWKGPDPGFYGPLDIATGPDGQLYIVDSGRLRIVPFDPASESFSAWGSSGSGPGQFSGGTGVAVGAGQVFVADVGNDRVQVFDLKGEFVREWAVPVWEKYPWHYPDLVVDEASKTVYLTNGWKNQILAFDLEGKPKNAEITSDSQPTLGNPSTLMIVDQKKERRLMALNTDGSKLSSFNLQAVSQK